MREFAVINFHILYLCSNTHMCKEVLYDSSLFHLNQLSQDKMAMMVGWGCGQLPQKLQSAVNR